MTRCPRLLPLAALVLAGCTTAFWDRPGTTRVTLARDTEACYRLALDLPYPAALPGPRAAGAVIPADQPPPALWRRSPGQAGFPTFDSEQRYARCMRDRGYHATRPSR